MSQLRQRHGPPFPVAKSPSYQDLQRRSPVRSLKGVYAFGFLFACRCISALFNIVHDCDEVFNYWEPLHYLLYGSGLQTWEYSADYALRSYLYLLLHATVGAPAAVWFGPGKGKLIVFYLVKIALGAASAATEAKLYRATCMHVGARTGNILLLLLAAAPGLFFASTSLLPSSFTMYLLTLAAAFVLEGKSLRVVACAVVGVICGWTVAGLAFVPYAFYVLFAPRLGRSILTLISALALTLLPTVAIDTVLYGKLTVSLLNFLRYNVAGGGDSALYGTEGPAFYIRNGLNNLNLVLLLVLLAPGAGLAQWWRSRQKLPQRLLLVVAPAFLWLAAITALPHKEERFLYVTYPLMCLVAAAVLAAIPGLIIWGTSAVLPRRASHMLGRALVRAALLLFLALSASRITAILTNYSASTHIYRYLPEEPHKVARDGMANVCTGAEWHRFPSAFFLPSPAYRLAFIPSTFNGLLPARFDVNKNGTAAAPASLNDRNKQDLGNVLSDASSCAYLVTWSTPGTPDTGWVEPDWEVLASLNYVDASQSPSWLARALYIPWLSARRNKHVKYVLLRRM